MIRLYRGLIVLSISLMAICTILPFERPFRAELPLDQPLPAWFFAALALVCAAAATPAAAVGLLRFRHWGRTLGTAATLLAAMALGFLVTAQLDVALGTPIIALSLLGALAWVIGLLMAWHPGLVPRFRA